MVSARSRPRGDGRRAAERCGARDVIRERRPDLGVARRAVGESRRAAQDTPVARATRRAAALPATARRSPMAVEPAVPDRVPSLAHAAQHAADPGDQQVLGRRAPRAAQRSANRLRRAAARHIADLHRSRGFRRSGASGRAGAPVRHRARGENGRGVRGAGTRALGAPRLDRRRHVHGDR